VKGRAEGRRKRPGCAILAFVRRALLASFALPVAVVSACISPPENEVGGDARFDASPPSSEALCAGDPSADAGNGHHFSDLYRDYFGPTARSSCAGTVGNCHGTADGRGAMSSGGYVCGPTPAACWQGMTQAGLLADTDPSTNGLLAVLRRCDGSRFMPKQPTDFYFYAADLQRIKDWLAAGAPND
jgi:hypothetical protein